MTFRARLIAGFLVVALLPLSVLGLGVRREMHSRVLSESQRRADTLATIVANDLAETHAEIGEALARIATALLDDPRFRAAALRNEPGERGYLIDYAGGAMRAGGLSLLEIRNDSGRIISSGHFPAEIDRVDAELPDILGAQQARALVRVRTADGTLVAAARTHSVTIAGRRFALVGGRAIDQSSVDRLARGEEIGVDLLLPNDTIRSGSGDAAALATPGSGASGEPLRRLELSFIDATATPIGVASAELAIVQRVDDSVALRKSIDRWIIAAFLLATAVSVLAALWLASRLSRPMEELAAAASTVDLDRLDVRFATSRDDEIGVLSRRLSAMVERLRGSAARLREAERRATVGEIARQVNHDIKNGLAPIRNVVRHLAQVAHDQPAELPSIFTARQRTLESSIGYLETLAQNYARLSPTLAARPTEVGSVVAEVTGLAGRGDVTVTTRVAPQLPSVLADAVVLRRILENLVGNAVDSIEGKAGQVTVIAEAGAVDPPMVRLTVADTGRGMTETELARAFDDFYTTKPQGTGLGLSVVRRLVADLGGSLRIETEPGIGTKVQIDLPAAPAPVRRTTPTPTR